MKNLKYAYLAISKKVFLNFIIMLQVIVASFIIYSSLKVSNDIVQDADRILNIFNNKKAWYMKVSNDFMDKLENKKFTSDDVLNAYNILKNSKFVHFYSESSHIPVEPFEGVEKFRNNPSSVTVSDKTYLPVNMFYMDKEMNNQFQLNLIDGRGFNKEDFEKEEDKLPVVLGYNYKDKYKAGDTFHYYSYEDKTVKEAKVIGILQKDSYLLYKVDAEQFTNLNDFIVSVFVDLDKLPKDELLTKYYIQTFDLFNTSYLLFDKSKSDDEIQKIVGDVNKSFISLNIGKQNIENVDNYLQINKEMLVAQKHNSRTMATIIVIFLSIGITSSLLYSIKKEKKHYGIHILNGATINDICIRLFSQTLIICLIGFIASIGILKSIFNTLNFNLFIQVLIVFIIISLVTSIIPIVKVKRLSVVELIKDGD